MNFLKRTIYFLINNAERRVRPGRTEPRKLTLGLIPIIIIFLLAISGLQIVPTSLFVSADSLFSGKPESLLDISRDKIQQKYQKANKIKQNYKMQKASFVKEAKDQNAIQMEIGDKTKDEFEPEMTIRKWDDEVNFNIKYKHNVAKKDQSIELDGKKIKWKNHKTEVHFYEMEDMNFTELDSNGKEHIVSQKDLFEFDIILNEKLAMNVVEMEIETKGLKFYYQPELTQKEKDDGAFRPENVIGSYAVYHESKQGDYSKMGGKNYMAGKAFHIYRPKIFDAEGSEIWGQLNIDEEEGILSIEVPQEFLDTAVYPVRVDPTFGCDPNDPGGSWTCNSPNFINWNDNGFSPPSNGILNNVSVYVAGRGTQGSSGDGNFEFAVYKKTGSLTGDKIQSSAEMSVLENDSAAWKTVDFSGGDIFSNCTYQFCWNNEGAPLIYYDSGGNGGVKSQTYGTWPSSLSGTGGFDFIYSIYCTYTAAPDYSVMASNNYTIQSDSINFGGGRSSSTSYVIEDTLGEIATGVSTSSSYSLHAGYQQMYEVYLSMTSAADVTLTPSIGGVTGGIANGSTTVTVTTDSVAGYELSIKASSSPAFASVLDNFADYTTASAGVPDFTFTIAATSSEFGFSPEGGDVYSKYKDNGSACNTGSGDTTDRCWESLSTTNELIAKSTTANHPNGVQTTIKFRAQSGSSHIQIAGNYTATTTITAIAL